MQREDSKLKQYLLGALPEGENRQFDLRVIDDEDFTDEVSRAEHDVIEDHLEGLLSAEESELFKSNFLTSQKRMYQLREIELLKSFAKSRSAEQKDKSPEPVTVKESFFIQYFRPLLAVTAVVVVSVGAWAVIWLSDLGTSRSPLEMEYAQLNEQDLGDIAQLSQYSSVNLVSGNLRSIGSPKQNTEKLTDTILFRLALPANAAVGAVFNASIEGRGAARFELDNIRVYRNANGQELRILIPKAILQKGENQINVRSDVDSIASQYTFAVE